MRKALELVEYADFHENPHKRTCKSQLNQIVNMHGFVRLLNQGETIAALKSIHLMTPFRSTLKESISSVNAFLPPNIVKDDLSALGWQECSLVSIQTLNPTAESIVDIPSVCASSTSGEQQVKKSSSKRRKLKSDDPDVTHSVPSPPSLSAVT